MNNGATSYAVTQPVIPAQIKVASLAGDLYGAARTGGRRSSCLAG